MAGVEIGEVTALQRWWIGSTVGCALALQLAAQTLGVARGWPFVPYEMYSWAHAPGERFAQRELRAVPDPSDPRGRRLYGDDLHMSAFRFMQLLGEADGVAGAERQAQARQLLARLIAAHGDTDYRAAQLWRESWQLGAAGELVSREPQRELVWEWGLLPSAAQHAQLGTGGRR